MYSWCIVAEEKRAGFFVFFKDLWLNLPARVKRDKISGHFEFCRFFEPKQRYLLQYILKSTYIYGNGNFLEEQNFLSKKNENVSEMVIFPIGPFFYI